MTTETLPEIDTLSFEQALKELEAIVRSLESGQADLEKSIALYDRGAALRKHCEAKLTEAQAKVEKITLYPDGTVQIQSLDPEGGENDSSA